MLLQSATLISRKPPFAESGQNNSALSPSLWYSKRLKVDQNTTTQTTARQKRILQQSAQSVKSKKRQIDETSGINLPPAQKARLACTKEPELADEEAQQAATEFVQIVQQPKPLPPKRSYAAFLEDSIGSPVSSRYRPDSVDSFVRAWVVDTPLLSQAYRERHCRSDSFLGSSNSEFIPRRLTKSAPNMEDSQDRFVVPPTPSSTASRSFRADAEEDGSRSSASSTTGVRNPLYRQNNLRFNNIHVRHPASHLPDFVSSHVHAVRAQRNSPGPTSDELKQYIHRLDSLAEGCTEDQVSVFLKDTIFPNSESDSVYGPATGLASSSNALMSQHLVPADPTSPYRVTQPKPDLLYAYSGKTAKAFTQSQLLAQTMLHPRNPDYPTATLQGLRFPFFAIEFKAAGGTRGDLWVATNQCASASSACLKAVERLNILLREHECVRMVDNVSYSIAVDNNIAQLYISWKEEDLNYFVQRVDSFLLSSPDHFINFRKQIRNVLDWGKDKRLEQIRDALDTILEENRRKAAGLAKARPLPDASASSSSQRRKTSSSHGRSRRAQSVQQYQSEGVKETYWEWDAKSKRHFHREGSGSITWAKEYGQSQ
ncbi:hypothetical protein K469DRAFT_621613 [Zopfia rhizophila CBS 207.26]|uniref:DUF7924 domain-containing protein n=1 Tax=Zopfia rhizophila CBS 207.26 TaxID=1314779 RepID=A0A6A6ENR6_9PEZI|nr:hypothetical protein K469DRAFT_621613 [Zopfia rhizophila CBS 207.26]